MGYALRRDDDDDGDARPIPRLRDRLDRWVERIKGTLRMSESSRRYAADAIPAVRRTGQLMHNWDGHFGDAAPLAARMAAERFLRRLEAKFGSLVPEPTVGVAGQAVILVWHVTKPGQRGKVQREVEITFTEKSTEWHVSDRDGIEPSFGNEDEDPDRLLKVVDQHIIA